MDTLNVEGTGVPQEYLHYFFAAGGALDAPWEDFARRVNRDVADSFGNFVNRTLRCSQLYFGLQIPRGGVLGPDETLLSAEVALRVGSVRTARAALDRRGAIGDLRALWRCSNRYIDTQAPWESVLLTPDRAAVVLRTCINLIRVDALAANWIVPGLTTRVLNALCIGAEEWDTPGVEIDLLEGGRPFVVLPPVVEKIPLVRPGGGS